jgi:putative endonuclease
MYYVYILRSKVDKNFYVGYTKDLRQRLELHMASKVPATRFRVPLDLIYYEACINKDDAVRRERYLKSTYGKRYIRNRLKNYLLGYSTG